MRSKLRPRRNSCALLALLAGLAAGPTVAETIYKCRTESGTVAYSAAPCRPGARLEQEIGYEETVPPTPAASPRIPAAAGRDVAPAPVDDWPRRPGMEEERRRAAVDDERARLAAERDKRAEGDPASSLKCIEMRRRIGRGGLTLGHVQSEGCL